MKMTAKLKKTLVLDSQVVDTLDRYGQLLGVSRSSVANAILLEALPMLNTIIDELEALLTQKGVGISAESFEQMQRRLFVKMTSFMDDKNA